MSTIIATTLSNGSVSVPTATVVNGSAKAWANLNGTGTIALRDSFNVSGAVDNGTGNYSFSFSNATANANYSVCVGADRNAAYSDNLSAGFYAPLTTGVSAGFGGPPGTAADPTAICVSVDGDLA